MSSIPCEFCGYSVPLDWDHCPHCARPGLFPNVRMAEASEEKEALERRYRRALQRADRKGAGTVVRAFESEAASSRAVIARSVEEVRLLASNQQLYSTYYQKLGAGTQLPSGDRWDRLRGHADDVLFGAKKDQVRFAALSLDGRGLWNYGDCSLVLRDDMIRHRASVFEGNSAMFLKRKYSLPAGHRATWSMREKLCVAKSAEQLKPITSRGEFPSILLAGGATTESDRYVEVHIWGSMSARTFERALLKPGPGMRSRSAQKDLQRKLTAVGIDLEIV